MLGWKRNQKATEKHEGSAVRPVLISLRKYREIFGDSDEEVLHFTVLFIMSTSLFRRSCRYFLIIFFPL